MSMTRDESPSRESKTADEVVEHIEQRARTVRENHVERAVRRVDDVGEITPRRRAVIAALADRLTSRLVARPKEGVRTAARADDERALAVAYELFSE